MSQPCNLKCDLKKPGEIDAELSEFWEGNPWLIYEKYNLSCFERNRTYLNVAGQQFIDISFVTGADNDGDSRSSIAVDVNHDGRLDLLVRQAGGGPLLLFENEFPSGHWLQVSLRGTKSNRLGIGSRLTAKVGEQTLTRELYPANSYLSQSPSHVHFGLGAAEGIERLEVKWPSGLVQVFENLQVDRHLLLEEGRSDVVVVRPGQRKISATAKAVQQ